MQKPDLTALLAATDSAPYNLAGYAPQLEPELRPCVYLLAGEAGEAPPLGSQVGGAPALPAGAAWPADAEGRPLAFLLQVNLGELPELESSPLPAAVLLSFFAAQEVGASDVPHCIFYFAPEELAALEPHAPPYTSDPLDGDLEDIQPHALEPRLGWTLPSVMLGEGTELVERLLGAEHLYDYFKRGKLDMAQARRWQHLLTLDSSDHLGLCIWDAGFLSFLIEEGELAALDSARSYAGIASS